MARTVDPDRVARRRDAIVDAAGGLFGRHGYDGTTVAQVARAAGMSPAAVFYYFPDKAAVFRALFERDLPRAEALVAAHADDPDPVAGVVAVVEALAADAGEEGAAGIVADLLRRVDLDPQLADVVVRTDRVIVAGVARLVARGISGGVVDDALDPHEAAGWLQAVVDGTYLHAEPGRDLRPHLRRTVRAYLAPASRPHPPATAPTEETPR